MITLDRTIAQDIEEIAKTKDYDWSEFKDSTVMVTGATGLIGSQLIMALLAISRINNLNIKTVAVVRNKAKAEKVFKNVLEDDDFEIMVHDIMDSFDKENVNVDYIIHGASITSSKAFVDYPVETIMTAIKGTENILEFAKKSNVKGFVYLSSMEVYGVVDENLKKVTEKDYGYIDPVNVRSSYSEGKRMVECLCISYAKEFGVPVKVARLTQTFGPGVEYTDNRVFAQFARSIIEHKDIVLHTTGETIRNYCYTKDAIQAIFTILLKGELGEAYNVANVETTISIKEMAELIIKENPDSGSTLRFEIDEDASARGYNPKMVMRLCTDKLNALGWKAETSMETMFQRLITSMLDNKAIGE